MPDEPGTESAPEERSHHPDSPSGLQNSEACPLFENEQRQSVAAEAGVLQHKAIETRDTSILESEEQVAAVQSCIDYAQRVGESRYAEAGEVLVIREEYLGVGDDKVGAYIGVTGGYPDEVYVSEKLGIADVLDWKFGRVPVTPTRDNIQGISYALALFGRFASLQEVVVHFRQPYQGWSEDAHGAAYVHAFRRSECTELELRVRTVVARKKAAQKRLSDSGSWQDATPKNDLCIWCARKGDCKKLHAIILRDSEKHPDFVVPTNLNTITLSRPEECVKAYRWANQVAKICEAIKFRVADMVKTENLELGDEVKLVKRVERRIKSLPTLIDVLRKHGIRLREIVPMMTISITAAEKAVKARAPQGKGTALVRTLQQEWIENGATELGEPIYFLQEARSPKEKSAAIIEINP